MGPLCAVCDTFFLLGSCYHRNRHCVPSPSLPGFMYVLGVQCFFTKWMEMVPVPDKKATTIVKQLYIIFTRCGCPDVIVSDRGTEFCNQLNEALFYYFGIEHRVTAPYHPEANGSSISHIYFPDIFFHFFNSTISISYS